MQSEYLIKYTESPYTEVNKEVKDEVGNVLLDTCSGSYNVVADGVKDMRDTFMKCKDYVDKTLELKNLPDQTLGIDPKADVLYRCIEKQPLTFQTIVKKCMLKVSKSEHSNTCNHSLAQKQLVILELSKRIHILKKLASAFKAFYICIAVINITILLYKIYKSRKLLKEIRKLGFQKVLPIGFSFLGSKLGALVGAFGGPVGSVVGSVLGCIIFGLIGSICGKKICTLVDKFVFPNYNGGPGQPPVEGTNLSHGQPKPPCVYAVKVQTQVRGLIPKGQPKIPGAEVAFGLPKLW